MQLRKLRFERFEERVQPAALAPIAADTTFASSAFAGEDLSGDFAADLTAQVQAGGTETFASPIAQEVMGPIQPAALVGRPINDKGMASAPELMAAEVQTRARVGAITGVTTGISTAVTAAEILAAEDVVTPAAIDTNVDFLTALYQGVLNRTPDNAGITGWALALEEGRATPADVVNAFWFSTEHRGVQVDDYYLKYLGRAADPDGRAFWVSQMVAGMSERQVQLAFLNSAEYQANLSSSAFVNQLYLDLFNRPADPSGLAVWTNALNQGAFTRAQAADFFVNTQEAYRNMILANFSQLSLSRPTETNLQLLANQLTAGTITEGGIGISLLNSSEFLTAHPIIQSLP